MPDADRRPVAERPPGVQGRPIPAPPPGTTALGWLARGGFELVAHSLRTARLSSALCRRLGWSEIAARELERAALFHDIGKTVLPRALLAKPGPLTEEEIDLIRRHPAWGASLLASLELTPALAPEVALHHHERWDGAGYPFGLANRDIPEAARIVAVADAYDALTADRTYRQTIAPREALERLRPDAGTQFDSAVFEALIAVCGPDGAARAC